MPIYARGLPTQLNLVDFQAALLDIYRRAVDGTVVPLFIDSSNQRVLVGATVSAGNGSKFQVTGDIEVIGSANGLVLPDENGSGRFCRVRGYRDALTGNWTLDVIGL